MRDAHAGAGYTGAERQRHSESTKLRGSYLLCLIWRTIMKRAFAFAIMAILSPAMNVVAGEPVVSSKEVVAPSPPPPSSYFRANELDLGAFATYGTSFGSQSNFKGIGDHAWGGGAEVSYFPLFWAGLRVQGAVINLIPGDNTAGIVRGRFFGAVPVRPRVAQCSSRSLWDSWCRWSILWVRWDTPEW
jgi:hypothetical protein